MDNSRFMFFSKLLFSNLLKVKFFLRTIIKKNTLSHLYVLSTNFIKKLNEKGYQNIWALDKHLSVLMVKCF